MLLFIWLISDRTSRSKQMSYRNLSRFAAPIAPFVLAQYGGVVVSKTLVPPDLLRRSQIERS